MKKIDFTLIADVVFYGAAAWFLSIGILRYYRVTFAVAAALAALFSLAAAGAVFLFTYRRHRKRKLNKSEMQAQENLLLHLALEKEERVLDALFNALTADGVEAERKNGALYSNDRVYVPRFTMQPLSADETARVIRAYGGQNPVILCNELSAEAERLAASFGVKTMCKNEIYSLFTRTNTTPSPLILAELPRKSVKRTFRRIVSKRSARPFFTSGILLLFMSLFTFFPLYYLISGCVLTSLAILVRLFGFPEKHGDYA